MSRTPAAVASQLGSGVMGSSFNLGTETTITCRTGPNAAHAPRRGSVVNRAQVSAGEPA
jgi:hypothetical protein